MKAGFFPMSNDICAVFSGKSATADLEGLFSAFIGLYMHTLLLPLK